MTNKDLFITKITLVAIGIIIGCMMGHKLYMKKDTMKIQFEFINLCMEDTEKEILKAGELLIEAIHLKDWCKKQAKLYYEGKLDQERIDKLNSYGFDWEYYK